MIPRQLNILKAVAAYYTLTRAQIQEVTGETNARVLRKHLQQLVRLGLLNRTGMEVVNPGDGAPAPVYFLSRKGAELLAAEVDERYLHCCTQTPNWQHLRHWTTVAQFHVVLDRAVALQDEARVGGWLGEWDVATTDEKEPEKRFTLYSLLREKPRLVSNPDAAFLLCVRGFAKVYYVEVDRATSGIQQIANSKSPGYAELLRTKRHRRHFETNMDTFGVLSISPTAGRRDLLRKALKGKDGCELWKFCCWPEFTPASVLLEPIWWPCEGEPAPLIKRLGGPKSADLVGSAAGSGHGSAGGPPRTGRGQ
jgi:hypothetical protein